MKVLLLAENWPPRVGGIENYLTNIARGLPSKSVTVIAPQGSEDVTGSGINTIEKRHFFSAIIRPRWLPLLLALKKKLKKEPVDIILCGKALFEGLIGYYLKKSFSIPYVVFTYAMEIETWAKDPKRNKKLKKVLQNADHVVYINELTKKTLLELGVTEKQLVKIWPGVGERYFAELDSEAKAKTLEKHNLTQPYILCVSRLIERKGVDLLIDAFSKLDQATFSSTKLVIVGDGPERAKLQEQVRRLSLTNSVFMLGAVPDEDLVTLYKEALFFALPPRHVQNDYEGFGIVYLEAAAAGLATIGTLTGGVSEAITHKITGLVVQPDSPDALHEALTYMLTNKEERIKMAEAGKVRAWNEFRWSKRILLVKGMLDALLAEKVLSKKK